MGGLRCRYTGETVAEGMLGIGLNLQLKVCPSRCWPHCRDELPGCGTCHRYCRRCRCEGQCSAAPSFRWHDFDPHLRRGLGPVWPHCWPCGGIHRRRQGQELVLPLCLSSEGGHCLCLSLRSPAAVLKRGSARRTDEHLVNCATHKK